MEELSQEDLKLYLSRKNVCNYTIWTPEYKERLIDVYKVNSNIFIHKTLDLFSQEFTVVKPRVKWSKVKNKYYIWLEYSKSKYYGYKLLSPKDGLDIGDMNIEDYVNDFYSEDSFLDEARLAISKDSTLIYLNDYILGKLRDNNGYKTFTLNELIYKFGYSKEYLLSQIFGVKNKRENKKIWHWFAAEHTYNVGKAFTDDGGRLKLTNVSLFAIMVDTYSPENQRSRKKQTILANFIDGNNLNTKLSNLTFGSIKKSNLNIVNRLTVKHIEDDANICAKNNNIRCIAISKNTAILFYSLSDASLYFNCAISKLKLNSYKLNSQGFLILTKLTDYENSSLDAYIEYKNNKL